QPHVAGRRRSTVFGTRREARNDLPGSAHSQTKCPGNGVSALAHSRANGRRQTPTGFRRGYVGAAEQSGVCAEQVGEIRGQGSAFRKEKANIERLKSKLRPNTKH